MIRLQSTAAIAALSWLVPRALSQLTWELGNGFNLFWNHNSMQIVIQEGNGVIWETLAGQNFLSASAGNDSILEATGSFKISVIDEDRCKGQNVTEIRLADCSHCVSGQQVVLAGHLLDCGISSAEYSIAFWVPQSLPDRVAFRVDVSHDSNQTDNPLTKVFLQFQSNADEDFYGLGAQASFASLKGQTVPIFSREQGVGRGDQPTTSIEDAESLFLGGDQFTTYTAIPQYVSTAAKAFYLGVESTALAFFDFQTPNAVIVRYDALSFNGHFLQAENMLDAISKVTDYTGKMPALPRWVDEGAIIGIEGGQEKVRGIVKEGLELGCPLVSVWIQDWCGRHVQALPGGINISRLWWNWESDQELYPTWGDFVQSLRDDYSVRTLSYINPFLVDVSLKPSGYKRNLFAEALEDHYLVWNTTTDNATIIPSGPGFNAGIQDLTNPAERTWFKKVLIDQVWNANISGFMTDFGEYTPITPDTSLAHPDPDAFMYHNQYPGDWAAFHRSIVEDLSLTSEAVLFHRSASMSSNRHMNLFWAGDQDIDWGLNDGIKSVVTIMGHMGISGYAQTHSDIGGDTTIFNVPTIGNSSGVIGRTAELLGRWGELAAVSSAVYRSHEGDIPSANVQTYTNSSTYSYFAHSARLFRSLGPYRRRVLDEESIKLGWPLLRMPVLYHTRDAIARNISYQSFYLGPDLYVAPVLDQGKTSVDVYLPQAKDQSTRGHYKWASSINATYTHVWTGKTYQGGQTITVPAPYGQPAVFVVDGAKSPELDVFLDFVHKANSTLLDI